MFYSKDFTIKSVKKYDFKGGRIYWSVEIRNLLICSDTVQFPFW